MPPTPSLKLSRGEGVKVFGPMTLMLKSGSIEILGKKVRVGERIIVHKLKSYPVIALEDSEIDLTMVNEAQIKRLEEDEAYFKWVKVAEEIAGTGGRVVVVLGEVDSGKSSFTTLVLNKALEAGLKPALVDADVGQADVAPPGYVSLAYPDEQVLWNRSLKPVRMLFVGDIKPQKRSDAIIASVKRLVETALSDGRSPVVVDTDGWIKDVGAVLYKFRLVAEVKPDFLVYMGGADTCFKLFEKMGVRYRLLGSPAVKKTRDRSERREYRSDRYREFFANAPLVKLSIDELLILDIPVLQGLKTSLGDERVVYSSLLAGKYFVVAKGDARRVYEDLSSTLGRDKVVVYPYGFERGLYVSLVDDSGLECPGLIERVDFSSNTLYVRTPCTGIKPRLIKGSSIRLTEDFHEEYIDKSAWESPGQDHTVTPAPPG
ncbi:MAG: GTPase [Thermogladius sp.]|nr:GTPase [Thermogladius sp.]